MADRDTNRFDRPYDPEETARQVNENGCTYHSGRMNEEPFDPGIPQTPPDGEYHYSYRDMNRGGYQSQPPYVQQVAKKPLGNGVKTVIVLAVMLLLILLTVGGGLIFSRLDLSTDSFTASTPVFEEESIEKEPEIVTPEPEAPSYPETEPREELEVPELNMTTYQQEEIIVSTDGKLTTPQIYKKVRPSVVGILNYLPEDPLNAASSGSGIIISEDGYILTNAHVLSGAANLVVVLDTDEEYAASVIGIDVTTDLAVIKIEGGSFPAAELGNSEQLMVGEKVVAIGNPAGMNLAGSTSEGIVSGLDRTITVPLDTGETVSMEVIQTDAAINPGNSGGPLINEYGDVIGINSSKLSSFDGIGFAIPVHKALPIVEDLIRYGYVTGRVKLGITYYEVSEVLGAMYGYTPGLLVYSVDTTMDVYEKGLRSGDTITHMDGQVVTGKEEIDAVLEPKEPGDTLTITFIRGADTENAETITITVLLGEDNGVDDTDGYSTEPATSEEAGSPNA